MTPLFSPQRPLHAASTKTIQNLNDDAPLFLGNGRDRAAADRRRNLLKIKAGIVCPLVVE